MSYKYTHGWFLVSELKQKICHYIDNSKENHILEIGCYEGLSSVFFADNLLDNPKSTLTYVDPFLNIDNNDHKNFLANNEEQTFNKNISICRNSDKISVHKITSDAFLKTT